MNSVYFDIKKLCSVKLDRQIMHKVYSNRSRRHWAISVKTSGKILFHGGGKQFVHDEYHVMVLPRASAYSFVNVEPGDNILIDFELNDEPQDREIFQIKVTNPTALHSVCARFEDLFPLSKAGAGYRGVAVLYELLAVIDEQLAVEYADLSRAELIRAGVQYLKKNFKSPTVSSSEAARHCRMSPAYFRRMFGRIYRMTPTEYIGTLRLECAKSLLSGEFESVEVVAQACGFSNLSHFYKSFAQSTGMTPKKYAAKHTLL
ncbi:helix-turn-helix transcriptional regulator [Paenibacillus hemerocallicola]|uniref:Helix-turn-helix transcriptional regulator n=1 Tax=Paenibacillus hemerocallicola TaxID=1172614 RepID=A0A5C4TBE1_9BACL|nr:helix-turn-helix transcriptional regulator [Paenibacillus hemerocallicola]TNJ65966.1 helix-turn-helix transcriptional regulator [Paenibacillus hemerocallicola]